MAATRWRRQGKRCAAMAGENPRGCEPPLPPAEPFSQQTVEPVEQRLAAECQPPLSRARHLQPLLEQRHLQLRHPPAGERHRRPCRHCEPVGRLLLSRNRCNFRGLSNSKGVLRQEISGQMTMLAWLSRIRGGPMIIAATDQLGHIDTILTGIIVHCQCNRAC